jgi:hypothetical protein
MDLDQRRCFRRKRAIDVRLRAIRRPRRGWTRDISLNGAFVEMSDSALVLPARVEVVLRFSDDRGTHEHPVLAQVTRMTPEGVALRFCRYDGHAYASLMNLLYAA